MISRSPDRLWEWQSTSIFGNDRLFRVDVQLWNGLLFHDTWFDRQRHKDRSTVHLCGMAFYFGTDLLCTYVEWRSISAAASRVNSYEEQGAIMCPHERHAIAVTGMRVRRPPRAHDACACYDRSHHSRAGRGCGTADDVIVFVRGTACPVLRVWPRGRHDLRLPATAAEESICTTTYNPARDGRARALPLGVVRTSTRFTSY